MIDVFFALIAAAAQSGAEPPRGDTAALDPPAATAPAPVTDENTEGTIATEGTIDTDGTIATIGAPSDGPDNALDMTVVPAGLVAEPQTPSGKFTTATEIKPIMNATKANWIAVREYDGSDLLYVTHIWSWRCGLAAMAISVNDEPMQNWPLPECHLDTAQPNALTDKDGLPFLKLKLGSVETVTIQLIYDDLTGERVQFNRADVLMP